MGHNNMCSNYNGLIGPGVVAVATEFHKFWLKAVYTARPLTIEKYVQAKETAAG